MRRCRQARERPSSSPSVDDTSAGAPSAIQLGQLGFISSPRRQANSPPLLGVAWRNPWHGPSRARFRACLVANLALGSPLISSLSSPPRHPLPLRLLPKPQPASASRSAAQKLSSRVVRYSAAAYVYMIRHYDSTHFALIPPAPASVDSRSSCLLAFVQGLHHATSTLAVTAT